MIEKFLNYLRLEKAYSPHTVVSYGNDIKAFEVYLGNKTHGEYDLVTADADLVRGWAVELMSSGCNATTVNRKLSSLRTFYKFLLKKEMVTVSPVQNVHGPKKKKPLPQFVREADMERLLCGTSQGDAWEELREYAVLQLFYETGIRLSELVGLDVEDVDFGRKTIKVTGKRNKQRVVPIGEGLAETLKRYVDARSCKEERNESSLFITDKGKRVYPHWVYRLVRKNLSQVVSLKKRSPHVLRHTFATAMLNNEAELEAVKELMGHESVSTTQIYTHTTFEELKKAYSKAHPRASIN